ncbi:MAG: toprim domain-containing protein [Deltaproteobacteria bacterium]|nr:toprim domain-containing protein [Deltaproteobacteria bacterium]
MSANVNANVSLERFADARGVTLRKKSAGLIGKCPLHEGTGTTLTIDPKANTWTCSSCSPEKGSVVSWVMRAEGVSKKHAIELLKADYTGSSKRTNKGPQKGVVPEKASTRKIDAPFTESDSDAEILAKVVGFYHATLKHTPDAVQYLQSRGIVAEDVIDTFKLGYANRTLGYRVPAMNRRLGAELRGRLQRLGVLRDSGHEHMTGSVVVPLFDDAGNVVNMYGRKILDGKLRVGTPMHCWLDPSRRGLFNCEGLSSSKTLIVTGSILDALTFYAHGQTNVTAVHGLDGPTEDLVEVVKGYSVERVLIAFRRSSDGDAAAERLAGLVLPHGVEVFRVVLPAGMDVSDYARSVEEPTAALMQVVRAAMWMGGKTEEKRTPTPIPAATFTTTREPTPTATAKNTPGADDTDTNDGDTAFTFDSRRWRVRPLPGNAPGTLRANVFVSRDGLFHVDVFDLYSSRHRAAFVRQAVEELHVEEQTLKADLGHVLLRVEADTAKGQCRPEAPVRNMTDAERQAALSVLRDPNLLDRIVRDFDALGVVGEHTNLTVGYLATVSRLLDRPLAVVIQSSSAAGKSSLMDAILSVVPPEERMSFSALTGQSLFYMGGSALKHKVLAVAEEAGAERAAYALKLLQSDGALTIASTGKDPSTGRLTSQEYRVEGPVAMMMTTTAIDLDEELLSRCLVLTIDEGPEQTRAIQEAQRHEMTLEGRLRRAERDRLVRLHHDVQRLLRPVLVVNPFAATMTYPDHRVRGRRDHRKLLALVEAIALLHQHQRPLRRHEHGGHVVEYIEVAEADIDIAHRLLREVGGVGADDLPPQTRNVLGLLDGYVRSKAKPTENSVRFTRREVREALGLGDTQAKIHLRRLVETEYVRLHPSPFGRGVVYELAVAADLGCRYGDERAASGRPVVGPWSGGGRASEDATSHEKNGSSGAPACPSPENARLGTEPEHAVVPTTPSRAR